jgi:HD-GYP domain-containing protein (c-di-GMP phosphodiesterase class II)
MTVRPRRLVLLCGVVPAVIAALLSIVRPSLFSGLEFSVYDALVRAAPKRPPDSRVVIVDVDEPSLSSVGQWPWRRDVVGQLIGKIRELGAAAVALDIVFAESDRYEGGTGSDTDAAFAETLRAGRVVLGYALTFETARAKASACVQHPIGLALVRREDEAADDPFFRATGAICTLPLLTKAAGASGFLNAAPDPDGILRRAPLLIEFDGQVYPALSLAAVRTALKLRETELHVANVNTTMLALDDRRVPLDGKGNLTVRYRGEKRAFRYVSAADVLSGQLPTAAFQDKIVFVGTTALGTREVVATPLDTLFAGVEVQATVADNLLQQDYLHRPEHAIALETQIVLGIGIVLALVVGRLGLLSGAMAAALALAAVWGGALWLITANGTLLSPLFPTIAAGGALAAMTVARFTIEHRRADQALVDKTTSQRLMVQSLLSLTEVRDLETGRHSRRTQLYARVLAEQLATNPLYAAYLTPERIDLLSSLAPLHDIGKVGVPDRLLNKPGALTPEELAEMRKHPAHGRDVIVHAEQAVGTHDDRILALAKEIVYTHHERWDGTGYPEGLRGPEIPIPGRLMAIVDVYDAIRSRRVYQQPISHPDAVAVIVAGRGTHFDPAVVDAFLAVSAQLEQVSNTA